jgi:hypothetical protein
MHETEMRKEDRVVEDKQHSRREWTLRVWGVVGVVGIMATLAYAIHLHQVGEYAAAIVVLAAVLKLLSDWVHNKPDGKKKRDEDDD